MSSSPPQPMPTTPSPWWSRPCRVGWIMLRTFWVVIVLALIPSAVIALVFLSQKTSLQSLYLWPVLDWMQNHLFLTGLIILVLFGLTWLMWYGSQHGETATHQLNSARAPTERDRTALLQLLGKEYRRQLSQSLHGAAMMELGLQERTDVISPPAQLVSWPLDVPEDRSFPAHASIVEAYDEASNGLLILGAPGAGKSTLLRELTCELVSRAEKDPDHPIPVLVNLSSWAIKKLPLESWLVEQLQVAYSLPRHLSQSWSEQDQFLLLLDGLDEMEASARPTCIEYINAYRGAHFVPLVVCSRSHEYLTQAQRLSLPYAVEVQPLAPEKVDDYLKRAGKQVAAVRAALRSSSVLHDMVTTPLMLSVIVLAYRGQTAKDMPQLGTPEEQQRQLFAYYVEQMLEQRTKNWQYCSHKTRRWLIWLARQMQQHQITEFYLESLQRFWLPSSKRVQVFYRLLFKLISRPPSTDLQPTEMLSWSWSNFLLFSVLGLISSPLLALLFGLFFGGLRISLFTLLFTLLVMLLLGLNMGLSGKHLDENMRLKPNQGIHNSGRNACRMGLFFGLLAMLVMGLVMLLSVLLLGWPVLEIGNLLQVLVMGLVFGLYFGLTYGGTAFLNHYLNRFFLWRSGVMPWHYVRFLDETTERILLQPVGGGYRFIHPLFQEYFASLDATPSAKVVTPPTSHHP